MEKLATWSAAVVAPTVMARAAEAGELKQASSASLPAAATTTTPAACAAATALFSDREKPPPSDIEMTAFESGRLAAWSTAHAKPAITLEVVPVPLQLSTCTLTMAACFATPCVAPAAVLAQCVPWDEQLPSTRPWYPQSPDEQPGSLPIAQP